MCVCSELCASASGQISVLCICMHSLLQFLAIAAAFVITDSHCNPYKIYALWIHCACNTRHSIISRRRFLPSPFLSALLKLCFCQCVDRVIKWQYSCTNNQTKRVKNKRMSFEKEGSKKIKELLLVQVASFQK